MPRDAAYVAGSDDEYDDQDEDIYNSDEAGPSSRPAKKQRGDYGETLSGSAARGNKKANVRVHATSCPWLLNLFT